MATQAYRDWVARGRQWKPARPVAELVTWARANGIRVLGTIGDEAHLQRDIPEDHTPFSATAWPVKLPGYVVCAIDLENRRLLGEKIEAQARAGRLPWLKYMNHSGRQISFKGARPVTSASRDHHVHLSIRTDYIGRSIGRFDPWGTTEGDDMPTVEEVWRWDGIDNPYGDRTTNPKIAPATALRNIGGQTENTMHDVAKLRTEVALLRSELRAVAERPQVAIPRDELLSVLTEVIGKVDGR